MTPLPASEYRDSTMHAAWKRSVPPAPQHAPRWPLIATLLTLALFATSAAQPTGEDWFTLVATGTAMDVRTAIDAGADALERDADGWTTIAVAAAMNPDPAVIEVLLAAGADHGERVGAAEWTPLMVATMSTPNVEVVRALIASGADVHARDTRGATALHTAAQWAPYRHARPYLLDTHTVGATNIDGDVVTLSAPFTSGTGLFEATIYLEYLDFEFSARIVAIDDGTKLRLTEAVWPRSNPRLDGITLYTPRTAWLDTTAKASAASIGQALLEAGADPDATTDTVSTPLMVATTAGLTELMHVLLSSGANVNARSERGRTALMYAATRGKTSGVLQVLLDAGADVNARDGHGWTALMDAAHLNRDPDVPRALLDAGADVNARNEGGRTALIYAARRNSNPLVLQVLLEGGADAAITDRSGLRAIDYARDNEHLQGTDAYWRLNDASFD